MSNGLLFVTAQNADYKTINRALCYLRDWEYGAGDGFQLITTRNAYNLTDQDATEPGTLHADTVHNAWAGASRKDVEAFLLDAGKNETEDVDTLDTSRYILIDDQGVKDQTCIIGERYNSEAYDPEWQHSGDFDKVRVPWEETHGIWCNLSISNMNFWDFCDEDQGPSSEGWWQFQSVHSEDNPWLSKEYQEMRDAMIENLTRNGHA